MRQQVYDGLTRFRALAERARHHHMMMAWSKFSMLVKEIKCLGLVVSEDGMRPDEARCRELVEWPEPTTRRELCSYLGLYAYLAHAMLQSTTASCHAALKRAGLHVEHGTQNGVCGHQGAWNAVGADSPSTTRSP